MLSLVAKLRTMNTVSLEVRKGCDTMADNTGHRLLSTGNRKSRPMTCTCLNSGWDCVQISGITVQLNVNSSC
jgi:hypothetical protein